VASVPPQVRDGAEVPSGCATWRWRRLEGVGTLLKCYQLSDEDTIRTVMDNPSHVRRPGPAGGSDFLSRFSVAFPPVFSSGSSYGVSHGTTGGPGSSPASLPASLPDLYRDFHRRAPEHVAEHGAEP